MRLPKPPGPPLSGSRERCPGQGWLKGPCPSFPGNNHTGRRGLGLLEASHQHRDQGHVHNYSPVTRRMGGHLGPFPCRWSRRDGALFSLPAAVLGTLCWQSWCVHRRPPCLQPQQGLSQQRKPTHDLR